MAKRVGFTRTIKPHWLNKTVELVAEGLGEADIKAQLDEYISFEISDKTNIGKARNILMNTWSYENDDPVLLSLKEHAVILFKKYPEYRLVLHWCMMLRAYPVFKDISKLLGRMVKFQAELALKQIKQKLFDEWGESTTLFYSIDKLIATMKNLDTLTSIKPGLYRIKKHKIGNPEIVNFMLYVIMMIDSSGYHSLEELRNSEHMFPFNYKIEKEHILNDKRFVVNNFGGEPSIGLNLHS